MHLKWQFGITTRNQNQTLQDILGIVGSSTFYPGTLSEVKAKSSITDSKKKSTACGQAPL